jgi:hypothetical protein
VAYSSGPSKRLINHVLLLLPLVVVVKVPLWLAPPTMQAVYQGGVQFWTQYTHFQPCFAAVAGGGGGEGATPVLLPCAPEMILGFASCVCSRILTLCTGYVREV